MNTLRTRIERLETPTFRLMSRCPHCGQAIPGTQPPNEPCEEHQAPGELAPGEIEVVIERT